MTSPEAPEVARAALAAAVEILSAENEPELAEALRGGELVPAGPPETWEVGSSTVSAHALALVVGPREFVRLREAASLDKVRDAIASAVRSPGTELGSFSLVVRLPGVDRTWGHAYRGSARGTPERPPDAAVKAGALELARALADRVAEAALTEATLESAEVPSSGDRLLRRYVLRLAAPALARAERHRAFADRLKWLVEHAGTRAVEAVAEVELRLRLRD